MVLRKMQALLGKLYDLPSNYDIYDFLVTDRARLASYWRASPAEEVDERVLVSQTASDVRIGVYIDAAVLKRLDAENPFLALNDANLADYCAALEGVSHFQYLAWRVAQAEAVSLLELELQAEVDKYAAAMALLTSQCAGRFPGALHDRLFRGVRYAAGLSAEEESRYRIANERAAMFCRRLDRRFLLDKRGARPEAWLQALRRFYRCGGAAKVRQAAA